MKIKEIAEKLQITPRAIRFYEQKGLIAPSKDQHNAYREFTEQDAWRLQMIIALRQVGISLEDLREILNQVDEGAHQDVLKLLDFQRFMLYAQWSELKQIIQTMDEMIALLERKESLAWNDIFKLADGSKRLRDVRKNWVDQWDFDQQAAIHDDLVYSSDHEFDFHPKYEEALQQLVEMIAPLPMERGLDLGAGTGNLVRLFEQRHARMTAIDQSKEMLARCKAKNPRSEMKLGNFLAIPCLDQSFDFVVTSYAFHLLSADQKPIALAEMKRVLKPEGRLAILDLMYVDQKHADRVKNHYMNNNKQYIVEKLESRAYPLKEQVSKELKQLGYATQVLQMDDMLHLIYALPESS